MVALERAIGETKMMHLRGVFRIDKSAGTGKTCFRLDVTGLKTY